jgi:3-oxoacyl-(acyl-carrier-protein) synthase
MQYEIKQYWKQDIPDSGLASVIGEIPKRWGRMDTASRIAVVEIGLLLKQAKLLAQNNALDNEIKAGLIVGSKLGSLATDLAFCQTLEEGIENASPILFGYTLPNIPLAEAACHYRITGPVYSIISEKPLSGAIEEAHFWLKSDSGISFIIAGELDVAPKLKKESSQKISAKFKIIKLNHA